MPLCAFLLVAVVQSSTPSVTLHTSLFASTYGVMREALEQNRKLDGELGLGVEILRKLELSFPEKIRTRSGAEIAGDKERVRALYWRTLDAYVFISQSMRGLRDLPGEVPDLIGGYLPLTDVVEAISRAISPALDAKSVEKDGAMSSVGQRVSAWKEKVEPRLKAILACAQTTLGITAMPRELSVVVLPATGGREGMTVRTRLGPQIVIGAGKYEGSDFSEVVIHELVHALDSGSPELGLLPELRKALREAKRSDEEIEQTAHAVIFTLAAGLTREFLDPVHIDVGVSHGAYARGLEKARRKVEGPIGDLRVGKIGRDEAIRLILSSP